MKKIIMTSLFVGTFLVTIGLKAQTAEEVVTKYINAIGGFENWKKVNSIYYEAELNAHGNNVQVYKTILNGKGMRRNMVGMGAVAFEIMTPKEGWEFLPFMGQQSPVQVEEDRVRQSADQYDAQGILVDYKAKGHSLGAMVKETLDGKECYKITVKHKTGKEEDFFFDTATYLLVQINGKQKMNGNMMDVVTRFGDYSLQGPGIRFPMSTSMNNMDAIIKKVEINKVVNENIFQPVN